MIAIETPVPLTIRRFVYERLLAPFRCPKHIARRPERVAATFRHHRDHVRPRVQLRAYRALLKLDVCVYCNGAPNATHQIDHINPRAGDDWWNLTSACASCNRRKARSALLLFLLRRAQQEGITA